MTIESFIATVSDLMRDHGLTVPKFEIVRFGDRAITGGVPVATIGSWFCVPTNTGTDFDRLTDPDRTVVRAYRAFNDRFLCEVDNRQARIMPCLRS